MDHGSIAEIEKHTPSIWNSEECRQRCVAGLVHAWSQPRRCYHTPDADRFQFESCCGNTWMAGRKKTKHDETTTTHSRSKRKSSSSGSGSITTGTHLGLSASVCPGDRSSSVRRWDHSVRQAGTPRPQSAKPHAARWSLGSADISVCSARCGCL